MSEIFVYLLHIDFVKEHYPALFSMSSEERKAKAKRFVREKDRLLCIGAGYLLKRFLPAGEIQITTSGKPFLSQGPFFNLSHSEKYIALAIHESKEIGVDIEYIDPNRIDGIRFVLSENEKQTLDAETNFRMWTNKESLTKCIGTGIKDIKSVPALPLEGLRQFDSKYFYTASMVFQDYALSVTLKGDEPFQISIKQITALEE